MTNLKGEVKSWGPDSFNPLIQVYDFNGKTFLQKIFSSKGFNPLIQVYDFNAIKEYEKNRKDFEF